MIQWHRSVKRHLNHIDEPLTNKWKKKEFEKRRKSRRSRALITCLTLRKMLSSLKTNSKILTLKSLALSVGLVVETQEDSLGAKISVSFAINFLFEMVSKMNNLKRKLRKSKNKKKEQQTLKLALMVLRLTFLTFRDLTERVKEELSQVKSLIISHQEHHQQ